MSDDVNIALAQNALASRNIAAPQASDNDAEMRAAAKEFEAVFISEMFSMMTQALPTDGPFGGGHGEAMMRSMLNNEYAKSISSRGGGIGLSDAVYRELLAIQEGTGHASPTKSE